MGRKAVASPKGLRGAGDGSPSRALPFPRRPPNVKIAVFATTILVLLGIVVFELSREGTATSRTPSVALSRPAATPQRPAWTREEEAYIQALWPIHGDIERSAVRVSLGKIFYTTNDIGRTQLKAKVDTALATYRRAEARISELQPPPSLARAHDDYLAAIRLFEQSALEVMKMFDDGNDEHLLAAYPMSQEGSDKIREIGAKFWEDEFPPN